MLLGEEGVEELLDDGAAGMFRVFKANVAAARAFRQRPYPGRATVFRAEASDRLDPARPAGGWEELAAEVEVVPVPGDHQTMVRPPHVAALAAALRRALDAATARRGGPPDQSPATKYCQVPSAAMPTR